MTSEELQAIRERVNKATPGPWRHIGLRVYPEKERTHAENEIGIAHTLPNSHFIAHARTDLPKALDVIEAMIEAKKNSDMLWEEILIAKEKELYNVKAEIKRLRGALEQIANDEDFPIRIADRALAGDSHDR